MTGNGKTTLGVYRAKPRAVKLGGILVEAVVTAHAGSTGLKDRLRRQQQCRSIQRNGQITHRRPSVQKAGSRVFSHQRLILEAILE